jgi:magnesium chelatase family protein
VRVLEPGRDLSGAFAADVGEVAAEANRQAIARDLSDLVGQPVARRAAEICAAGGHHLMLLEPPGVGKPMHEIKYQF